MGIRRRWSVANEVRAPHKSTLGDVEGHKSILEGQPQDFLPGASSGLGWRG